MTRINLVPPEELSRQHLVAEYRELPRIFALVRAAQGKGLKPANIKAPAVYVLGRGTKKQFACATIEQAVESFKKRKARQARILESQAAGAREAHDLAHTGDYNMMPDWFNPKPQETAHDV